MFGLKFFNRLGRGTIRIILFFAAPVLGSTGTVQGGSMAAGSEIIAVASPSPSVRISSFSAISNRSVDRSRSDHMGDYTDSLLSSLRWSYPNPFEAGAALSDDSQIHISHLRGISACMNEARLCAARATVFATTKTVAVGKSDHFSFIDGITQSELHNPAGGLAMAVVVPLPTSFALGGLGLITLAIGTWRKRCRSSRAF